jgi:2-oxoisovalerate dehydrogenase E1 component
MSAREMTTLEAMVDALRIEMRRDPTVIYLGEGTGERGGTYGHTLGLFEEFGPERMIDTPISELGFTGACVGAAVNGCRPVADLMFMDFAAEAMSQIVNQAAKLRYMSNGQIRVPLVVWAGVGAIKSAGPHHSGCLYPWFMHVPGLKVVFPSGPADAKGLYAAAIRDDDPVVYCAHKLLFPRRGPVPAGEYVVPLGQAAFLRDGGDAAIIATGLMVTLALEAAEKLAGEGIECQVLDLRSLVPMDTDAIVACAAKTGRVLVVDEAYPTCGVGAEIAAIVNERAFRFLRAPVLRLHTLPVSHPFSPVFDSRVLPQVEQIVDKVYLLLEGGLTPEIPRTSRLASYTAQIPDRLPVNQASTAGSAPATSGMPELGRTKAAFPTPHSKDPGAASPEGAPSPHSKVPVLIPNQGLTVEEACIVRWLVAPGERVRQGQALYEIETDKAVMEVEAEQAGIIDEIVAAADAVLPLGACVAWLRPD